MDHLQAIKEKLKQNKLLYKISQPIYYFLKDFKLKIKQLVFSPFLLMPIKNNKIVFVSYKGDGFGDSGKRIIEYMEEVKAIDSFEVYWALSSKEDKKKLPNSITGIKYPSISFYYHMSTAKFWIDNSRKYEYPFKRSKQKYIQNWHGGLALKKIEKDAGNKLSDYYIHNAKRDSDMVDLFTSNSKFQTNLIKESFWYNGEIAEIGTPRVDYLLKVNDKEEVKQKLGIPLDKKVALYAPTFRNTYDQSNFINDFEKLSENLTDYIFLVRYHPNDKKRIQIQPRENVMDATNYPDMYELMKAADILITDYSSSMFEFSFMKKPVFLFVKDYNEYLDERGLYFNIEKLPYSLVSNEKDLIESINNFNLIQYQKELESFFRKIDLYEQGNASKSMYNYMMSQIK